MHIPLDVSPPFHFSALAPGIEPNRTKLPFRMSAAPAVKRPSNLEDVAFWPVRHLAELMRTRQVTSRELTEMYLARLHRYNAEAQLRRDVPRRRRRWRRRSRRTRRSPPANTRGRCTAFRGARRTSSRSRATRRRGAPRRSRIRCFDYDASVVEHAARGRRGAAREAHDRRAGAGRQWFGGRTNSPWDPTQGSSGSSAGPSSATAAGCVAFAHRHRDERIDSQSGGALRHRRRCGRRSAASRRYGVMALSWTQDRLGPMVPLRRRLRDRDAGDRQARRPRHERVGHSVQLGRAARHQEAARRLHQGVVRRADECRREGATRSKLLDDAAIARRHEVHRDEDSDVADQRQQPRRRVVRVLRRDAARGQADRLAHGQREPSDRAAAAGGRVPAAAAAAHDDDDGARGGDEGRRRVPRRVERRRRRRRARTRGRSGRSGGRAAIRRRPRRPRGDPAAARGRRSGARRGAGAAAADAAAAVAAAAGSPAQRHSTMANLACYPAINVPNGFIAAGIADQRHVLRAAVRRNGAARAGEGVPGRRRSTI